MFFCPSCNERRVPLFEKLLVSPKRPAICGGCKRPAVVNDSEALASLLPLVLGVLAAFAAKTRVESWLCGLIGVCAYLVWFLGTVPLRLPQRIPKRPLSG